MLGSDVLEVAIGLVFIYLLLSLMVTAVTELLAGWRRWRSTHLFKGLRNLLGNENLVALLYKHPWVNGLVQPAAEKSVGFGKLWSKLKALFLPTSPGPSYIPSNAFARALIDLVKTDQLDSIVNSARVDLVTAVQSVSDASTIDQLKQALTKAVESIKTDGEKSFVVSQEIANVLLSEDHFKLATKDAKEKLIRLIGGRDWLATVVKTIPLLYKESGADLAKLKETIETWFNDSMDRVSGWYKRRTQLVQVLLALGFAVALNVDSVLIVKRLATDSALRKSIVAQAEKFAEQPPIQVNPPAAPARPQQQGDQTGAGSATESGAAAPPISLVLNPASAPGGSSILGTLTLATPADASGIKVTVTTTDEAKVPAPAPVMIEGGAKTKTFTITTKPLAAPASVTLKASYTGGSADAVLTLSDTPQEKYRILREQLDHLDLPVGWVTPGKDEAAAQEFREWPGWFWRTDFNVWAGKWRQAIRFHLLGWILTAAAGSIGAPFWFDVLNKFITIRSAGKKPEEKEAEKEKAKDKQK